MKIYELNIFSIEEGDNINKLKVNTPSNIQYMQLGVNGFKEILNHPDLSFSKYNRKSLYVLRNGNYIDIKNIITKINGYDVKIGRGGGQKSHLINPLDVRLTSYLMAMCNFDYELITYLNSFNKLGKNRYLLYYT